MTEIEVLKVDHDRRSVRLGIRGLHINFLLFDRNLVMAPKGLYFPDTDLWHEVIATVRRELGVSYG